MKKSRISCCWSVNKGRACSHVPISSGKCGNSGSGNATSSCSHFCPACGENATPHWALSLNKGAKGCRLKAFSRIPDVTGHAAGPGCRRRRHVSAGPAPGFRNRPQERVKRRPAMAYSSKIFLDTAPILIYRKPLSSQPDSSVLKGLYALKPGRGRPADGGVLRTPSPAVRCEALRSCWQSAFENQKSKINKNK